VILYGPRAFFWYFSFPQKKSRDTASRVSTGDIHYLMGDEELHSLNACFSFQKEKAAKENSG